MSGSNVEYQREYQRAVRYSNPEHPRNKYPDENLEWAIREAVNKCNSKISVPDVIIEAFDWPHISNITLLSRRDRQYLTYRIGQLLDSKYLKDGKWWVVR